MASGNRGHSSQVTQSSPQTTVPKTYANAMRPKNDQAIVIESIPDCTNDDYLDGLEQLVSISEITCISKISGSRVVVFLNNHSLVEQLKDKTVKVKSYSLNIRPYIENNKRVVISNISPVIPNEIVLDTLKKVDIIPVSQISNIRAGLHKPGRSHIISYRRQMYIKQTDESKIPESVQINYDGTTYWIYMSTDSTNCFICKQSGHVAKLCPQAMDSFPVLTQSYDTESQPIIKENIDNNYQDKNKENSNLATKRPPPSSTTSERTQDPDKQKINFIPNTQSVSLQKILTPDEANKNTEFKKPAHKKRRTNMDTIQNETITIEKKKQLERSLLAIKQQIDTDSAKYNLTFDDLKNFLENSHGQHDVIKIAENITTDTKNLVNAMNEVYEHLNDKSMKSRFTRLKKKLQQHYNSEIDSKGSSTSELS